MEYQFEYFTSERSEIVRCKVEQEKRYSISTSNYALFFFDYILDHFPKISEDYPKFYTNVSKQFPKIREDNGRLSKTFEENHKMFRSYAKKINYSFVVKHNVSEVVDIFSSEDVENS